MAALYPNAYGSNLVTLDRLNQLHGEHMHPEFRRRLFAWLESEGGKIGIGSGYRSTAYQLRLWLSNPRRYARPGNSFHEPHTWASGLSKYAAVDLVVWRGPGATHRSPTWAETETAKAYGLHTFITGEPWHMQLIETRSCSAWKRAGRPDPKVIQLPSGGAPPPTPPPEGGSVYVDPDTIQLGSTGGWVKKLQSIAPTFNQDCGPVDGQFGPKTEAGVKEIQRFFGLADDGIVGPKTWAVVLGVAP